MLLILGVLVPVAVLIFICAAAWHGKIGTQLAFALAVIGLITGVILANLPNIAGLVLKYGEKDAYSLQFQKVEQTAKQVQTDADEVRQMKEQIDMLVKRVEQGEKNVSGMSESVRRAYQSLFESIAYVILTRNKFPPPPHIVKELERHINLLATFAYPDAEERRQVIGKVMKNATAPPPPAAQPK